MATNVPVTLDTLIAIKIQFQLSTLKFKIPLRDLGAHVLPDKLRTLLRVPPHQDIVFERYSDSAGAYVTLDSTKPHIYKSLFRAAKAKLKLRLRATIPGQEVAPVRSLTTNMSSHKTSEKLPSLHNLSSETLTPLLNAPVVSPVIARTPVSHPTEKAPEAQSAPSPVSPPVVKSVEPEASGEAPVPHPFTASSGNTYQYQDPIAGSFMSGPKPSTGIANLAFRPKMDTLQTTWVVYCNNCNLPMEDEHWHCSICDHGDYDLCSSCVDTGIHCPGSNHWMVKRFVKNGGVVNSTTERIGPKPPHKEPSQPKTEKAMPGTFTEEKQTIEIAEPTREEEPTRTCNCCVQVSRETEFVTCTSCEDYDLCMECHIHNKHGHHPGHAFKAATPETSMPALGDFLCNAGRNVRHSAVCDGCEKFIYGVRHKCLNCPDWDFCTDCIKSAKYIHPGHRFVPIYEPLAEPVNSGNRHYGIYCDGPLCKDKENQSYVEGVRYKCAVCNDTDFCANCEAHPSNRHNHTHPLIKFKRPVRSVSVTTLNEDKNGTSVTRVGDCEPSRRLSPEVLSPASNAATQVQTVADLKPVAHGPLMQHAVPKAPKSKITVQDLLSPSTEVKPAKPLSTHMQDFDSSRSAIKPLNAHFLRDIITDGSKIASGQTFVQVWTLQNPGPETWPAGCSVRHVGGDNMLNIDNTQPLSQADLAEASGSNVIGWPVAPGQEVSFRVVMKAPLREGVAISYWRLKTAEGLPFGHRLWCDIQVVAPTPLPVTLTTEVSRDVSSRGPADTSDTLEQQKISAEKANMEKLLRIQKFRKAAVERLLENRRKEYEALKQAASEQGVVEPEAKETAELPVEEKPVEKPAEPELQSSAMIFPQLDKESPASSTHEAVSTQPESPRSEAATVASTTAQSEQEFFEDAESVEIRSISSDDGFMTDEEYDILDASDEELV
ncbi:unnamed protein product [Periconia digitata]|uniref:ZZ-type domain-containing protein n=1 Tax=Periconia digitata TaxID=1303443 RepID=A0A9W4XJF0_9PLEO|nr:unnamed protein product [Periconia digitata]